MESSFPLQVMSLLILKIGNTNDIVLLKGEQPDEPKPQATDEEKYIRSIMHKLPGGKFDSARDLINTNNSTTQNVWVAGLHEFGEEAGVEVRPQHILHGASLMFPYNDSKVGMAYTLIASITESDFKNLRPASGEFVRKNLQDIHSNPFMNDILITPMNNRLIDICKIHGATNMLFTENFPSVNEFGKQYLLQRSFKTT